MTAVRVLVVDAANVVGSRPDGWWRDRPGAARQLWDQLAAAELPFDHVVLVLEGAARNGVDAGIAGTLEVVHAKGHGDDAIVREVRRFVGEGHDVTAVTADRELRARIEAEVAGVESPSWLRDQT